jgi:hypothetical protein
LHDPEGSWAQRSLPPLLLLPLVLPLQPPGLPPHPPPLSLPPVLLLTTPLLLLTPPPLELLLELEPELELDGPPLFPVPATRPEQATAKPVTTSKKGPS